MPEEYITCYIGKTTKAITVTTPQRDSDFINFLYNPESEVVILEDSNGKIIEAYQNRGNDDEEYLQGKKVTVEKIFFEKLVSLCEKLDSIKFQALEVLVKCKKE